MFIMTKKSPMAILVLATWISSSCHLVLCVPLNASCGSRHLQTKSELERFNCRLRSKQIFRSIGYLRRRLNARMHSPLGGVMFRILPVIFVVTFFAMDAYSPLGSQAMWKQGRDYLSESYTSFIHDNRPRARKRRRRMTQRQGCNYRSGFSFYDEIIKEVCRPKGGSSYSGRKPSLSWR